MSEKLKQSMLDFYHQSYHRIWKSAFGQALSDDYQHHFWLLSPSGYLFSTDGLLWGMDIHISLPWIDPNIQSSLLNDLSKLDFIVLTHQHSDHFDLSMLTLLKDTPIKWYIPSFFDSEEILSTGIASKNITWVEAGQTYKVGALSIIPFNSPHVKVPEMGYFVKTSTSKLLFPCDVRDYSNKNLPDFGSVDYLFSHVWLGAGNALNLPCEPYLSKFCDFAIGTHSRCIFLSHLFELRRDITNMWTYSHTGLIMDKLLERDASLDIMTPRIGGVYPLRDWHV